jgi:hypothetical protein
MARGWLEAIGAGDGDRLAELMTPDGHIHTTGTSVLSGIHEVTELRVMASQLRQITKDGVRFVIEQFTEQDNRVAAEFTGTSELVNGTRYDNAYHMLFHFRDGKIAKVKEYLDTQLVNDTVGPILMAGIERSCR